MSEEIKVVTSLQIDNGTYTQPKIGSSIVKVDQNNPGGGVPGLVEATTAGVDVDLSALGTLGVCRITNLDSTNYVEWGPQSGGTFYPIGRIKPGDLSPLFRLSPGKTLHLKANTATCKCQVSAHED